MKHKIREFESKSSIYCIMGQCPGCSRVVDGRGIHDLVTYRVYECDEDEKCGNCHGAGSLERDCPECDGSGVVSEECLDCNGTGRIANETERKLIGKETETIKEVKDDK